MAHTAIEQLQSTVRSMCEQAGCASLEDLPAAEQRSARRRTIEDQLRSVEDQLAGLAIGESMDVFIAGAEAFNPDQLPSN